MKTNLSAAMAFTLRQEGGYVNHPKDPGGPTNLGITQATLSAWRGRQASIADVKALTLSEAQAIYKKNYWDKVDGDNLPVGLDACCFDYAVNSGPARVLAALAQARRAANSVDGQISFICRERLAFMRRLKTWSVFGKGWTNRVNAIEGVAHHMHDAAA